jgi:DNA-binding GntR family transcriptional regulator
MTDVNDYPRTRSELIIRALRREILSGALAPGTRLLQNEIAQRYRVSSTPVREAFAVLQRQGLLQSVPHKGVVVFRPSVEDLREIFEIRIRLEALATELAVPKFTRADIADIRAILDELRACGSDERQERAELDRAFHLRICGASGRPRLLALIQDMRDAGAVYLTLSSALRDSTETDRQHQAILDACAARRPRQAARAMATHLEHTVSVVSRELTSLTPTPPDAVRPASVVDADI